MVRLPNSESGGIGECEREVLQADGDENRLWLRVVVYLLQRKIEW